MKYIIDTMYIYLLVSDGSFLSFVVQYFLIQIAYHDLLTPSSEIYVYETLIDFERSVQIFIHSGDSA